VDELKACPFCGGEAKEYEVCHNKGGYDELFGCSSCGIGSDNPHAWNRRTPPPHTAAMLAWAKVRIAEIGELRRMDMVGFNELDEMRRLEEFVGEWEA
jgi:hypothetical protein